MYRRKFLWVVVISIIIFGTLLIKAEDASDEVDTRELVEVQNERDEAEVIIYLFSFN